MGTEETGKRVRSVLIVEDAGDAMRVLDCMITRKFPGISVHVAEDGDTGLRLCREHRPDIVITDINLPGIDGIMMAEEIKRIKPDTRFIIITGYSEKSYRERCVNLGVCDYLVKPVDLNNLFLSIEKCISGMTTLL